MRRAGPDLSALVASRLCHDLISPLGAIGNGVELLSLTGIAGPEIDLIGQSVTQANARLRLFRIAFGSAGENQVVTPAEVTGIFSDLSKAGRIRYDWKAPNGASRTDAKLALLSLLCVEHALAYGGQIGVAREVDHWRVTASAPKLRLDRALWDRLRRDGAALGAPGERPDVVPAEVQFALLPEELERSDRRLALEIGDTTVTLRF